MPTSPTSRLPATECRRITADFSIHWYPSSDALACHCGRMTRTADRTGSDFAGLSDDAEREAS